MSLLSGLNHLLSADTPNKVEKCMNIVFSSRQDSVELGIQTIKKLLELESYEFAESCYKSLQICIETVLFSGLLEDLVSLYESEGKDVDKKLQNLIGKIITSRLDAWREASKLSNVSLPSYVGMNWAIHVKRATSQVSQMAVPVMLLELQIQDQAAYSNQMPKVEKIALEMSKEKLDVLLDGFLKIKSQLSGVA